MDNFIALGSGLIVILALIFSNKIEGFASEMASIGSMPKNISSADSGLSIFMNLYPSFGQDFRLFDYIQKLKLNNTKPLWNGLYSNNKSRNLNESKKLSPIIIVPDLGASRLFARWNKNNQSSIKSIDESGNFETGDPWSCKQTQHSWVPIWPPNFNGLSNYCWADNVKVVPSEDGKNIINTSGVITAVQEFGSLDFTSENYMDTLITALEAIGYTKGENLFGAPYDFRKIGSQDEIDAWCFSLTKMIETNCALQEKPATIIGHGLGAVVANYFLVGAVNEWKDNYIKSFINISGTFGGCPKALKAVLSGVSAPENAQIFSAAIRNFSGLHLMLPSPDIYGDNPLVHLNQVSYSSYDIEKLISSVSTEAAEISKIVQPIRDKAMKAPGVTTYIIAGDDLRTESSYRYKMSLVNNPEKNSPFYQLDLPFNQKFNYPDHFIGDGSVPKFSLEYPIFWSKSQKEPVFFQFFSGAEHTKILSMYDPVKYIISIL